MDSSGAIVWVLGGALVTCAVSALLWDRWRWLRLLPVVYFVIFGLVIGLMGWRHRDVRSTIEIVAIWSAIGLGLYFAVWIQRR